MAQFVKALVDCPLGPGFESRVPQMLIIILFQEIQCKAKDVVYHAPPDLRCQMASRPNLKAKIERPSCSPVNTRVGNLEIQSRLATIGPKNCSSHHNLGPTPPLVYVLLLIIFIYFFYCFN